MSDYNMKGYLGKNRKIQGEKSPSHKGKCTIEGKDFWISAWVQEGNDGNKFFSLAFQLIESRENNDSTPPANFDKDVPF